jgi:hypothetical protein
MVSAVNTPAIPKYHEPLDWIGINYRVYLFASVRRGAGIHSLKVCDIFYLGVVRSFIVYIYTMVLAIKTKIKIPKCNNKKNFKGVIF